MGGAQIYVIQARKSTPSSSPQLKEIKYAT